MYVNMMNLSRSLETWAYTFLIAGIVVPATVTTLSYFRNESVRIKKAKIQGCKDSLRYSIASFVDCEKLYD